MEKTTNYQLNQWDANDKVQRVDFNADNAKIDAALKTNANAIAAEVSARETAVQAVRDACPLVVLRSVTLTRDTTNYSLPLTGFDWDLYREVTIYLHLKNFFGRILLNGMSGASYYRDASYGGKEQLWQIDGGDPYIATCQLADRHSGFHSRWYDHYNWTTPKYMYHAEEGVPRSQFETMDFIGTMRTGSRIAIVGVRAW